MGGAGRWFDALRNALILPCRPQGKVENTMVTLGRGRVEGWEIAAIRGKAGLLEN
jgi:hypothetical protein